MRKLLLALFLLFIPQLVLAENTPPADKPPVITGDFATLKHTTSARVDKVIDAQTILMKDGKIIRLLGIGYPFSTGDEPDMSAIAAKERLEKLLPETTEVMLYQKRQLTDLKRGRVNRMGHVLAHLVNKETQEWIDGTLVADGLAFTLTDNANPEMAAQLLAREEKARQTSKGLWAKDSVNGLLSPENATQGNGQFRVVEGVVNRAATSKNNLYLNFGDDQRKDFTVMIPVQLRKSLARGGTDPMALAGKKIRVRGWLREWNGPFMELEAPERLEIVTTTGPSTEASTKPSTDAVEKPAIAPQTGQVNP